MSTRVRVHYLLDGLVLLGLLLAPLQPFDAAQGKPLAQPSFAPAQAQPEAVRRVDNSSYQVPATGLFRTRVTVRNPADWVRLERLGVVVLETTARGRTADGQENADQAADQSATSWKSAVLLVDADQLEALARLRFEPQSTDELGALVAAHARAKPWLAAGMGPVLAGIAADQQKGADGADSSASFTLAGTGRKSAAILVAILTPELKADLAALTSVDDDADGLTNTEEQWWCTDSLNPHSSELPA